MAKLALGKGLEALIKAPPAVQKAHAEPLEGERVRKVPLSRIVPSPFQPRKRFDEKGLGELVDSIREHGVIQPLIVREVDSQLELIAGERRWRACQQLELDEVPVIVRPASDRDVLEMALIENLQREDLNPIEEAEAYARLAREFKLKQEEIAQRVGKNRATVANAIRLLDLEDSVRSLVSQGLLSSGHAKVILALKDDEEQKLIADMILKKKLTVRATEKLVSDHLRQKNATPKTSKSASSDKSPASGQLEGHLGALQDRLRQHFATHVALHHGDKKGRIEIDYYGNDDLDRILTLLRLPEE